MDEECLQKEMCRIRKCMAHVFHRLKRWSVSLQVSDRTTRLPQPQPAAAAPASPYTPWGAVRWIWRRRMRRTRGTTSFLLPSLDCSAQGLCRGAACPTLTRSPVSETADATRPPLSFHSVDSPSTPDHAAWPQKHTRRTGTAQVSVKGIPCPRVAVTTRGLDLVFSCKNINTDVPIQAESFFTELPTFEMSLISDQMISVCAKMDLETALAYRI